MNPLIKYEELLVLASIEVCRGKRESIKCKSFIQNVIKFRGKKMTIPANLKAGREFW